MDTKSLLDNIPEDIPEDAPIVMLNLLQWNEKANYPQESSNSSCSGEEAYLQRYILHFVPSPAHMVAPLSFTSADLLQHW